MPRQYGTDWLSSFIRRSLVVLLFVYMFVVYRIQSVLVNEHEETNRLEGLLSPHNHLPTERIAVSENVISPTSRIKLQEKLDDVYRTTGTPYQGNLWDLSDFVSNWMKEYFEWHKQERQRLISSNNTEMWKSTRLLVMQCLKEQENKCGGTADRMKPFLFALRQAYLSKRFLVIHWTLPAQLEEFLVPPKGGLDWRAPEIFHDMLVARGKLKGFKIFTGDKLMYYRNKTTPLMQTRMQSGTGFSDYYDEERGPGEASFEDVFHDVWRMFFTPSMPVRNLVETEMKRMALVPGEYSAAHLRALYGRVSGRPAKQVWTLTTNAVNCASKLLPGKPIFMASDHPLATQMAVEYGEKQSAHVVARQHTAQPLHLDKADNVTDRKPFEFYDTFIDLYLMGLSRCVTFNRGGFGQWASLISHNSTCRHNQKTSGHGIGSPCNWTEPEKPIDHSEQKMAVPFFVEPVEDSNGEER